MCWAVVLGVHFLHGYHDRAQKNKKMRGRPLVVLRATSLLRTQNEEVRPQFLNQGSLTVKKEEGYADSVGAVKLFSSI